MEEGWLDVRHDGRALQSIEPVDRPPRETRTMMVALVISQGPDLGAGLADLKESYDRVVGLIQCLSKSLGRIPEALAA